MKPSDLFLLILAALALLAWGHAGQDAPTLVLFVRYFGLAAFFLLSATLMIGPAAVLVPKEFATLIEPRKAVGLAAFAFLIPHLFLTFSQYFGWNMSKVFGTLALSLGAAAAAIIFILAMTSPDAIRYAMGEGRWKTVHRLIYISFLFAAYHSITQITKFGLDKNGNMSLPQIVVLAVGAIAVVMQVAGFYVRKKREGAAKVAAPAANPPRAAAP